MQIDFTDQRFQAQLLHDRFPNVAPHIRVMLFASSGPLFPDALAYPLVPGCTAHLCVKRGPDHTRLLTEEHARAWGVRREDVWFAAMQSMAYEPLDVRPIQIRGDVPVHTVKGSGWPASSHVLRLPELLAGPAPFGVAALLPQLDGLIFVPLLSRRSLLALADAHVVFRRSIAGEGPFLDRMLWWRGGQLTALEFTPGADGELPAIHSPEFDHMVRTQMPP
ncbi:hypothetical protein [Marinactinospora rubrisoli]|uniref:Uncharacterized protein n=1 Tax=Marinactinospora rubrisoli TaxID=2715399 RepID=A0ABW2KBR3_9ACTN